MKILIAGDSWGCGAWTVPTRRVRPLPKVYKSSIYKHPGLINEGTEFFLSLKGYDVINSSIVGGSNSEIFDTLSQTSLNDFDFVFVFFTNPLRDLCEDFSGENFKLDKKILKEVELLNPYINAEPKSLTFNDFLTINDILATNYKNKLEKLPYKNNIYIIGGHSKIPEYFNDSYNIKILMRSLREHFYNDYSQSDVLYEYTLPPDLLTKFDSETLEIFKSYADSYINLPNIQRQFFYPDGWHLNQAGHKILADYIHEFIVAKRSLDNKDI